MVIVTHFIKNTYCWLYYFVDRLMEFTGFGDVTLNIGTEIYRKLGANSCVKSFDTPVSKCIESYPTRS
jgi:hypothetical protein